MHKKCDCNGHGMKHHKEIKKHKPVIVDSKCPSRCDKFDRHDFVDHCPPRKVRKCQRCW